MKPKMFIQSLSYGARTDGARKFMRVMQRKEFQARHAAVAAVRARYRRLSEGERRLLRDGRDIIELRKVYLSDVHGLRAQDRFLVCRRQRECRNRRDWRRG